MATNTSTMLANTSPAPHQQGPLSDGNSSSLSELDDIPDEQPDLDAPSDRDAESVQDNDTEAETEHIDPSPAKLRRPTQDEPAEEPEEEEDTLRSSQIIAPEVEPLSPVADTPQETNNAVEQPMIDTAGDDADVDEADIEDADIDVATGADSPRKRKRSSSLSDVEETSEPGDRPARKRSTSKRLGGSASPISNNGEKPKEHLAAEDESEISDEEAADDEDVEGHAPLRKSKRKSTQDETLPGSPDAADRDAVDNEDGDDDDEGAAQAGDQDEAENAARNEEELAKKMVAMDNFKHIESKWAIFRDKLFDERLKELSVIQDDLEKDEPANTTFLRQRQCLDERRDEKIRIEDRLFFYKTQALERTTLAKRSICQSQFTQEVREVRDDHLSDLNEDFSRIQRERRQSKHREPQFIHNFTTERSQQINNQRAYNKEISLLSGIAKYNGFPGAPDLEGAGTADVESDLKRMNIKPKATAYSQIASSKHYDEMAGEANFLAKNTWARNPPLPPHILQDRPGTTPSRPEMNAPQHNGGERAQAAGSTSAIGVAPDLPNQSADIIPPTGSPPNEESRRESAGGTNNEKPLPRNALGVFSTLGDRARSTPAVKGNGAMPNVSHAPRVTYFGNPGREGERRDGDPPEPEAAEEESRASGSFQLSGVQERDRPQFGPLPSGIVADQGGTG